MNRETIRNRISSISGDIQRLSNALFALDNTDIPSHFSDCERLSLEAAQRAAWIALRLRHLVYILVYDRNLPERRIRDYDNLELKPILDAAAAY